MGFPNSKGKHAKESMISPKAYLAYMKKVGKYPAFQPPKAVILCYSRRLLKYVIEHHKVTKAAAFSGETYLLDETHGSIAIVGGFGIGAPSAATVLEELIAFGVKRFVSVGTAGTLQSNIAIGEIVVCDRAIRDEGTSYHYLKASKYSYASPKMTKRVMSALRKHHSQFLVGTTWTVDAPYRETIAEASQYQKEGVMTVEMEAAALFAVATYRKVDLAALFTVSDSLADLHWNPQFHAIELQEGLELLYTVAVDTLG